MAGQSKDKIIIKHVCGFRAVAIDPWKPYGFSVRGYVVRGVCDGCKRHREKVIGDRDYVYENEIPSPAAYNKNYATTPKDITMSKAAIAVGIVLGSIALFGLWLSGNYNSLVVSKAQVEKSWGMVETQYQRRYDLIGNLVETVKGAQKQEQAVFGEIAKARSNYAGSKTSSDQAAAAGQMETALARLLVITEAYPELKSNQNVQALQGELGKTEDGIAKARDGYNGTATNYNINITRFPKNIFARIFGFEKQNLFKADTGAEKAPAVKF